VALIEDIEHQRCLRKGVDEVTGQLLGYVLVYLVRRQAARIFSRTRALCTPRPSTVGERWRVRLQMAAYRVQRLRSLRLK
jgi:hypothetical protein